MALPEGFQIAHTYPRITTRIDGGLDADLLVYAQGTPSYVLNQIAIMDKTVEVDGIEMRLLAATDYQNYDPSHGSSQALLKCATTSPAWVTEFDDSEAQRPIRSHPGYRTCWEYSMSHAYSATAYGDFLTATTPEIPDDLGQFYRWIRDPAELLVDSSGKWTIATGQSKIKPGKDSYVTDSIQIAAYKMYTTYQESQTEMSKFTSGVRLAPGGFGITTYWLPGSAVCWLCTGASVKQEGFMWRGSVRLLYSSNVSPNTGWDTDMYPLVVTP
jgi:hypothetical protein